MNFVFKLIGTYVLISFFIFKVQAQQNQRWAYEAINIPLNTTEVNSRPILIAIIDDGFALKHDALQDFIYTNPNEIPNNLIDDDLNGYLDDYKGWDISDNDADASVSTDNLFTFYHGTYIASIITQVAKEHYGEKASDFIKIMPIKAVNDITHNTYVKDGYKGLRYAIDNHADVICMAWSGGNPSSKELKMISEAYQKGITLIGSVGNFNNEKVEYPAMTNEVIAVAATTELQNKEPSSNFGMPVDISAPGKNVLGAHPERKNSYILEKGTSPATALVAASVAILLSKNPDLSNIEIKKALQNGALPFPAHIGKYGGKLGAGILNLGNSLEYLNGKTFDSSLKSEGSFFIESSMKDSTLFFDPKGGYSGFYLRPDLSLLKSTKKKSFVITHKDVHKTYPLNSIPAEIEIPAPPFSIQLEGNLKKKERIEISFEGITIDSTTLYCNGTKNLYDEGTITDGSSNVNYSNSCSCRWIIHAPAGKRIKFETPLMDTEGNVDFVYLVDGETVIPEYIFAKFSGTSKPPVVFSRTNIVTVWFVTDDKTTGEGWEINYSFVD